MYAKVYNRSRWLGLQGTMNSKTKIPKANKIYLDSRRSFSTRRNLLNYKESSDEWQEQVANNQLGKSGE